MVHLFSNGIIVMRIVTYTDVGMRFLEGHRTLIHE